MKTKKQIEAMINRENHGIRIPKNADIESWEDGFYYALEWVLE